MFIFDKKSRRYRYDDGRGWVPKKVINKMTVGIRDKAAGEIMSLRQQYDSKGIRLIELLSEAEDVLSYATIALAGIESGGLVNNKIIESVVLPHVEIQRQYLTELFVEVEADRVSDKEFKARLDRYLQDADQGRIIADHALKIDDGFTHAVRTLGASEHCRSCIRYADRGISKVDDLPPPGVACECTTRCDCTIQYFKSLEEAINAIN